MSGPYSVTFYGGPLDGRTLTVTRLDQTVRVPVFEGEPTTISDVCRLPHTPEISYHAYDLQGRSYVSRTDPPDWLRGPRASLGGRVYIAPGGSRDSGWQEVGYLDDQCGFVTGDHVEPVYDFDPSDARCSFTVTLVETAARMFDEEPVATVNSATATRRCDGCEIYWTGGVHCWNCGQPGEISYGAPIQDQHGYPEIPW